MMLSLEYIAGLIDGEGCFYIGKSSKYYKPRSRRYTYYIPCVNVSSTHYGVLMLLRYSLEMLDIASNINEAPSKPNDAKYKRCWTLRREKKSEILKFCEEVNQYLVIKQAEAILMMKFLYRCLDAKDDGIKDVDDNEKESMYLEMKRLKKVQGYFRELNE